MKEPRYVVVEKSCCGTCAHYRQHYVLLEHGKFAPLWYGHCKAPRRKCRTPEEVCPHWLRADPQRTEKEDGCL